MRVRVEECPYLLEIKTVQATALTQMIDALKKIRMYLNKEFGRFE